MDIIERKKRERRLPQRYGQSDELELSDSTDSMDDFYKDNSMDDINYIPPQDEKVVTTVSKSSFKKVGRE